MEVHPGMWVGATNGTEARNLLDVVLIACDAKLVPHLRQGVTNLPGNLAGEFPDFDSLADKITESEQDKIVFVVQVHGASEWNGGLGDADYEPIRWLRATFPGQPIVALVEPSLGVGGVVATMRAGANQVVVLPLDPSDFLQAVRCVAGRCGPADSGKQVLAVCGVTGGCGATSVAVNLAYEIAERKFVKCLLTDMSLQIGKAAVYLDVQPRYTTQNLLSNIDRLDTRVLEQTITKVTDGLGVLAGPYGSIEPARAAPGAVRKLLEMARRVADVMVIDLPCVYDDLFFEILDLSTHVLLVGEQELPSLSTLKLLHDMVGRELPGKDQTLIINRYSSRIQDFDSHRLREFLNVPKLFTIANDHRAVSTAITLGQPLRVCAPTSRVLADIDELVDSFFAKEEPEDDKPNGSFLRHLFRALGGKNGHDSHNEHVRRNGHVFRATEAAHVKQ